jgi:murein DD-endopeptidase MepM/ murein hydrolase activator NlpD
MAAGVTFIAGWTIFATANFMRDGSGTIAATGDGKDMARYERFIQDLRASQAVDRSLLEQRSQEVTELEKKQQALETLILDMRDQDGMNLSSLEGDGASLLIQATIDEADRRESRDALFMTASFSTPSGRMTAKALSQDIERLVGQAEEYASARSERARGILQLTSVGADRISPGAPMGGPLTSVGNLTSSSATPRDDNFDTRINQARARVSEMKHYEQVVDSLPLGRPVSVPYRYTSGYGFRTDPFTRRPSPHMGLDMAAYRNAPIVASGPGTVIYSGNRGAYGLLVEIDHGHGFRTRYAHLRAINVKLGETVATGDLIGRMGSTGRSTGDHLHYEVWYNNKPYDPMKFLKAGRHVYQE